MSAKVNIVIDQGATFSTSYTILGSDDQAVDFTSYTANSAMKKTYTSSNAYTFDVSLYSNGQITLSMNAATTNSITAGRYVYDVEVVNLNGNKSRIVEGIVTVTPGVTR